MTTQRGSFFAFRLPRRLLVVGLALIGTAAVGALWFNLSPTGQAWAHYRAGAKLSCCGEPDPVAIEHFKTALRLNPRLFEARQGLAAIYGSMNKPREAEGLYEEAIRLDPSDPRPHSELAELAMLDHPAQAARHLEKCLSLQPRELNTWYLLAQCHEKSGRWKEALQVWETIDRRFPGDARAQRALPRVRKKLAQQAAGQKHAAAQTGQRAEGER